MSKELFSKLSNAIDAFECNRTSTRHFWSKGVAVCERDLLLMLLSIAAKEGGDATSGNIASALDLWIAEELRLAGFERDAIWPRREPPQVLDPSIVTFLNRLPRKLSDECLSRLPGLGSASVSVLGAAFSKQVDVGMATWPTGPEILISTKTMSGSFGKNWANRFEEAYGDVKNLKSRHPLTVVGFVMLLHANVLKEVGSFSKIVSMLQRLQAEDDAYDVVALLIAEWDKAEGAEFADVREPDVLLSVSDLSIDSFFDRLCDLVLMRSEVGSHEEVRRLRSESLLP